MATEGYSWRQKDRSQERRQRDTSRDKRTVPDEIMRLGVSTGFAHTSPAEWAKKQVELGTKAVVFPVNCSAEESTIDEYVKEAAANDLVIAEVGVWNNLLETDPSKREANERYAINQLLLAEKIGARCCVNIAGTSFGPKWDGGYKGNYSKEAFDATVKSVQRIIDAVKPVNTFYTLEPMPWMIPSSVEEYERLIDAIDRDAFAVHMDLINMINSPERYFFQEEFMDKVFTRLKGQIRSCHLKDVKLKEQFTFQLEEVKCGEGGLNIEYYTELATKEDQDMPMLIEHINTDEEYIASFNYVKNRIGRGDVKIG